MRSDLTGKSPIDFEMLKHYVESIVSSKER